MLLPSMRFDLPFTCTDSAGLPTAPTGTPAAVLVKNGTDLGTPVTVTVTGAQGIANCTVPNDAVAGDRFYLRISAVISGVTYVAAGPADSIESPQSLTSVYDSAKTAAPTATSIAAAVRSDQATELARLDAAVSTRLATTSYTAPPSLAGLATSASLSSLLTYVEALPAATEIASQILTNPTHKLLTNNDGHVTATNTGGSGGVNNATFVLPLRSTSLERVQANRIDLFVRERVPLSMTISDLQKQPVDCAGLTCSLFMEGGIEIPDLLPSASTPGGTLNRYTFTPPEEMTATPATFWFSLRVSDATERVLAFGHLVVAEVP